jgi:hypothetical protein
LLLNSHSCWYLGLGFISCLLLVHICLKAKGTALLLFLTLTGFGYLVEYMIYLLLGSYEYDPELILTDTYFDSNMGAIASNMLALPAAATLIAVFHLHWIWVVLMSGLFVGIEWLFLKLGIYTHNWWRLEYTAIGLLFYFSLSKVWYRWLLAPMKGVRSLMILFFIVGAVHGTLLILPIMFFGSRTYTVDWFHNPSRDTTVFTASFYLVSSLLFAAVVKLRWKYQWLICIAVLLLIIATVSLWKKTGIVQIHVWWDRPFYLLSHCIALAFAHWLNKRLARGDPLAHTS